jgi:hypothetical protein
MYKVKEKKNYTLKWKEAAFSKIVTFLNKIQQFKERDSQKLLIIKKEGEEVKC